MYFKKWFSSTNSRVEHTLFSFCTFGINYPNFGTDLLEEHRKIKEKKELEFIKTL